MTASTNAAPPVAPPQVTPPARVASAQPPASAATIVLVGTAVIAALYFGREVFIPLALAILLSFALAPIATRLRRLGLGRVGSVLIVVAIALGFVSGFAWLLANQAVNLAADLPHYEYNLRQKIRLLRTDATGSGVLEQTADMLRRVGQEIDKAGATGGTEGQAKTTSTPNAEPKPVQPVPVEIHTPPETPLQAVRDVLAVVAAPITTAGLLILFVIFVLLQREDLRDRFIRLFGSGDVHRTTDAMSDAGSRIGRYLLMQLVINCSFGLLFGLGLWAIGVPSPLLWGLIGAVLRFVPYIGAPIAMLFPLALALAVDNGWTMPILVFLLFLGVEAICAYVMEPLLYGHSTGLSPAAIIIAAAFWTVLWGPVGLLLSTPLTACLVVIGRHVPQLAFLEVIFGNEQPLSPAMRFYQRLLADDPREAEEVAEQYEREKGLVPLFDEVILPALGLLELDRQRGTLDRERQRETAQDVIEIAEDVADEAVAPQNQAAAILCLAARGSLDEAGACLSAAVLREQGYDVARLTTVEGSRVRLEELPRDKIRLLCLSRVDSAGLAQVRRVVRHLRGRLGAEVPIVLGLWNADPEKSEPEALARHLGVTRVALTLSQLLDVARDLLGPPPPKPTPAAEPARTAEPKPEAAITAAPALS